MHGGACLSCELCGNSGKIVFSLDSSERKSLAEQTGLFLCPRDAQVQVKLRFRRTVPYEYLLGYCGRTCILLWILYGNMVDFSFIVSLYVSDLPNVTISTCWGQCVTRGQSPGLLVSRTHSRPQAVKYSYRTYEYRTQTWRPGQPQPPAQTT